MQHKYQPEKVHKIIIKISGEILAGKKKFGIDMPTVNNLVNEIISLKKFGFSIGIVLGGGNFFRGRSEIGAKLQGFTADNIGMLATIQNTLILCDLCKF